MLVHIKEVSPLPDRAEWDFENTKFVQAYKVKSYDKFLRFIQTLKKYHKDLIVGDNWYTVEDYAFCFPENNESVPCLYVYVVSY